MNEPIQVRPNTLAHMQAGEVLDVQLTALRHITGIVVRLGNISGSFLPHRLIREAALPMRDMPDGTWGACVTIHALGDGQPLLTLSSPGRQFPVFVVGPNSTLNRVLTEDAMDCPEPGGLPPEDSSTTSAEPMGLLTLAGAEVAEALVYEVDDEDEQDRPTHVPEPDEQAPLVTALLIPDTSPPTPHPAHIPRPQRAQRGVWPLGVGAMLLLLACFAPFGMSMVGETTDLRQTREMELASSAILLPDPAPVGTAHAATHKHTLTEEVARVTEAPEAPDPLPTPPPRCTGSRILHADGAGPHPSGCFIIGCAEGYTRAERWTGTTWEACDVSVAIQASDTCVMVINNDQSTHTMEFTGERWERTGCAL